MNNMLNEKGSVECSEIGGYKVLEDLGTTAFSIYMAILSYRNPKTNVCNPSVSELHKKFKIAINTIRDNINKLYDNEYLDIDSGCKDRTNKYFFPKESWYKDWMNDPMQANAKRRKNKSLQKKSKPVAGIYLIYNTVTKKKYVGQSTNLHNRWMNHIQALRSNNHCNKALQADFNKYGEETFEFKVLEVVDDSPVLDIELNRKEGYWGKKFNVLSEGYNKANFIDPFDNV